MVAVELVAVDSKAMLEAVVWLGCVQYDGVRQAPILASDWSRVWILTSDWASGEAGVGDSDQPDREPEAEPDQPPLHVWADQGVTSYIKSLES